MFPFIVGILIANFLPISHYVSIEALVIICLALFVLSVFAVNSGFQFRRLYGYLAYLVLIFLGYISYNQQNKKAEITRLNSGIESLHVSEIVKILKRDSTKSTFILNLKVLNEEAIQSKKYKYLLYARGNYLNYEIGDVICHNSNLNDLPDNHIPGQFNYSKYLIQDGVFAQSNTNALLRIQKGYNLYQIADNLRKRIESIFKEIGIKGENLSVLIALTLGDKSFLNLETKSAFSHVGAMHILAVSGLHVGIVFLIFSKLLGLLGNSNSMRITRGILLLFVIWVFSFITGFGPSVQRAACMFSIIILAKALNRNTNIMNSIFGSAFLLLLVNPNNLFSVGFQLSYSAVIGIVLIYPILRKPFIGSNKLLNKILDLTVVSVSAQFATLPFTLYYFHLFPNWFMLSNLFVIPIAFALVSLSLLVILIFICFQFTLGIDLIINFLLDTLLNLISIVKDLPFAVSDNIWIESTTAILIGLLVWGTVYFLYFPTNKLRNAFLIILIGITIIEFEENIEQKSQSNLFVYLLNQQVVSKIEGTIAEVVTYNDSISNYNRSIIANHLLSIGAESLKFKNVMPELEVNDISDDFYLIEFNSKLIVMSNSSSWTKSIPYSNNELFFYLGNNKRLFNNLPESKQNIKLIMNPIYVKRSDVGIREKLLNVEFVRGIGFIKF